jgi:hypothetical protein
MEACVSFNPWLLYFWGQSPWYTKHRRLVGSRAVLDAVDERKILV